MMGEASSWWVGSNEWRLENVNTKLTGRASEEYSMGIADRRYLYCVLSSLLIRL